MERLKIRVIIETLSLAGILSLLFLLCQKNLVALGLLVGALTGSGSFYLLSQHIRKSTFVGLQRIKPYFFLKYLIRYAIMGVTLFLCARIGLNLFLGAAFGLLLIYLVIFKECRIQAK